MLTVIACGKVNLALEVLGKRPDGYHEVVTVLQEIDLRDTLTFEVHSEIRLETADDMVLKAARLLQEYAGCDKGVRISMIKGIPVAAGLGGSSSDAAATLLGLNELWGLSFPRARLAALASQVSADTAFFLYGGTALAEGRGERITPLPCLPPTWVVLLRPHVELPPRKTERLYASLDPSHFSDGGGARKVADALRQGGRLSDSKLLNVFEQVAFTVFPCLETYWRRFRDLGVDEVHLAGSGPTLFALSDDGSAAAEAYRCLEKEGLEAYLVQTRPRP